MTRSTFLFLACLFLVAPAAYAGDAIVNDRIADPPGTTQYNPHVALTYNLGQLHLVCVWEQRSGSIRSYAVAISQNASVANYAWVQHGAPPAPAGYVWTSDVQVEAPNLNYNYDGTFLIVGQVRTPGFPSTIGLASVRGHVEDENTLTWETPQLIETFGTSSSGSRYVTALTLAADSYTSAYVAYGNLNTTTPMIGTWYRKSDDFGTTWSAPMPSGIDTTGGAFASTPTFLPGLYDIAMLWTQTNGAGGTQFMAKDSYDGTNFGLPQVIRTATNRTESSPYGIFLEAGPMTAACDFYGLYYGTTFVASADEIDHSSYSFPDWMTAPARNEIEPNSSAAQANPIPIGTVIRGVWSDIDDFAFTMTAGQTLMMVADSVSGVGYINMNLYGPDGVSLLTSSNAPNRFEFTAPAAGTYYLNLTGANPGTAYRIRTMAGSPPGSGSRDQHDVFVTTGSPSYGYWNPAAVNASAQTEPLGFDEDGLTLTGNRDGYFYMSWYDWSSQPSRDISRIATVRSADGGQSWQGPVFVTSAATDWKNFGTNFIPFGPWQDMVTDGTRIHYVWIDGRNGDTDIYSRTIDRTATLNSITPANVVAHPGDVVPMQVQIQNHDDVWDFPLMIRAEPRYRNWHLSASYQGLTPSTTATANYSFTVPDTAAVGDVAMDMALHPGSYPSTPGFNPVYGEIGFTLTVVNPPLAAGPLPARLELAAVSPNPAVNSANLSFSLSRAGHARLSIFDVNGRRVRVMEDGSLAAGPHARSWDGTNEAGARVGAGAYFIQLEAEGKKLTRRMVWMR
jgi:hypothetical protein